MKKYKNNKTGNIYYLISFGINTTNEHDGQSMVLYIHEDCIGLAKYKVIFLREENEFFQKFTEIPKDYK